jgi:hypothetical protein
MFKVKLPPKVKAVTHHSMMSQAAIALGLTALSLLLLVLVLLSVPGPIKGLYWFSVPAEVSGMGKLTAGVLGWCGQSMPTSSAPESLTEQKSRRPIAHTLLCREGNET